MGDAMCGPSNPLQNFQKHTSVDRTLQQDRLASRQSPAQGFRSQNVQEGVLDPEFAAFESNVAGPSFHEPPQLPGPSVAATRQIPIANHLENSSWASDFQNLQISGPGPSNLIQHQRPSPAPGPSMAQRGWQNEFLNHQQQGPIQNAPSYNHGFRPSFTPMYPSHGPAMNTFQPPQDVSASQAPAEAFDESAFEAAFEQARADMETDASGIEQATDNVEPAAETMTTENARIGSDNIPQTDNEDPQTRPNDADELAKTAGQLLDSVQHDQSQKFKESSFLALMRRIRDREIQVEGDEFREVSTSP